MAAPHVYTLSLHDALPIYERRAKAILYAAFDIEEDPAERGAAALERAYATLGLAAGAGWEEVRAAYRGLARRSEEHTSELQSRLHLVCRLLLEKKNECRNT